MLFVTGSGEELHTAFFHPIADGLCLPVAHLRRLPIEGRLAESLFEHTRRMEQFVGDDRVEHSHASLIEHPHDRFFALQLLGQRGAQLAFGTREPDALEPHDVAGIVPQLAFLQPTPQARAKHDIAEVLAPQGRILHACLG